MNFSHLFNLCIVSLFSFAQYTVYGQSEAAKTANLQAKGFDICRIKLNAENSFYNNQYSGLYIANNEKLYIMGESRLQDGMLAYVDCAPVRSLDSCIKDSSLTLNFQRLYLRDLNIIKSMLDKRGQHFEGLEAMAFNTKADSVYFTIETTTSSDSNYIIKGGVSDTAIKIDTKAILGLQKPKDNNGNYIFNAGYESLEYINNKLLAVYEYNNFNKNFAVSVNRGLEYNSVTYIPISRIGFRVTDIGYSDANHQLYGMNFFYKNDGAYRLAKTDPQYPLVTKSGNYINFAQLLKLDIEDGQIISNVFATLPNTLWGYNFEGFKPYKNGFLLINDTFTPNPKVKKSALIFLKNQ